MPNALWRLHDEFGYPPVLGVHLQFDPAPEQVSRLAALLGPSIKLSVGGHPHPANFEILVHGFPTREDLLASPRLHTLIIPWAGPPIETIDLLREFPRIAVHNLPYNAGATAEMAIALLLAAAKMIIPYDQNFRQDRWGPMNASVQNCLLLEGKIALILGYGRVGRRVANACRGLGMKVCAIRRRREPREQDEVYAPDSLHELLPKAATLVICIPHTHETTGLIGERELALLPKEAVLVNVARGEIVVEEALYNSLKEGQIFAAGIDVWYRYPDRLQRNKGKPTSPSNFPFHDLDNVVMSPHRAGWSPETEELRFIYLARLLNAAAKKLPMPYRLDPAIGY